MLGYSQEELIKMGVSDIHPKDTLEHVLAEFDAQSKGEKNLSTFPCLKKDGTVIYADINAAKAIIEGRECNIGFFTDTTNRKKAEESLIESESRLKFAIDTLESGIWELNVKTGKAWRSPRHDQIFGYKALLPEWTYQMFLDHVIPEDRSEVDRKYGYALSTKTEWNFECRIRRVDNTVRWIAAQGKPSEYDDKNEVVMLSGIVNDITDRKKVEELIQASLKEKETLLKEVHHRVKNNMQVIKSLLHLQEEKIKDKDALALLKDSQQRIQAMALVYNKLYLSINLASINMVDYIKELTIGLINSYTTAPHRVTASITPSDVSLSIDMAIPCGLVINELVTNALKYAFPENRTGQIAISLKNGGNQEFALTVSDNGVGMPEGINLSNTPTLGLKLVTSLVQDQLEGKIALDRSQGTTFKITFPQGKEQN
jgi:PAS domain S-box-containing protein